MHFIALVWIICLHLPQNILMIDQSNQWRRCCSRCGRRHIVKGICWLNFYLGHRRLTDCCGFIHGNKSRLGQLLQIIRIIFESGSVSLFFFLSVRLNSLKFDTGVQNVIFLFEHLVNNSFWNSIQSLNHTFLIGLAQIMDEIVRVRIEPYHNVNWMIQTF